MFPPLSISARKLVRSLARRKDREQERAFLAEGDRLLRELANGDRANIRFLFGRSDRLEWLGELFPETPIYALDEEKGDLFATENPQGVGAVVSMPEKVDLPGLLSGQGPFLYLEGISDPGNAGTIVRSAEWFGGSAVLFGEGSVDPYNPKTVRSTMGAIFRLPVVADVAVDELIAAELPLFALDAGGDFVLGESELPRRAIYAIGNEAHGVSPDLLGRSRALSIAGSGAGESLNAAIAASVLLYELSRPSPSS